MFVIILNINKISYFQRWKYRKFILLYIFLLYQVNDSYVQGRWSLSISWLLYERIFLNRFSSYFLWKVLSLFAVWRNSLNYIIFPLISYKLWYQKICHNIEMSHIFLNLLNFIINIIIIYLNLFTNFILIIIILS
jgi:hypothetical protein